LFAARKAAVGVCSVIAGRKAHEALGLSPVGVSSMRALAMYASAVFMPIGGTSTDRLCATVFRIASWKIVAGTDSAEGQRLRFTENDTVLRKARQEPYRFKKGSGNLEAERFAGAEAA
jgi:hypothetical protein